MHQVKPVEALLPGKPSRPRTQAGRGCPAHKAQGPGRVDEASGPLQRLVRAKALSINTLYWGHPSCTGAIHNVLGPSTVYEGNPQCTGAIHNAMGPYKVYCGHLWCIWPSTVFLGHPQCTWAIYCEGLSLCTWAFHSVSMSFSVYSGHP